MCISPQVMIAGPLPCREILLLLHRRHFLSSFVKTVPSVCFEALHTENKKMFCILLKWCDPYCRVCIVLQLSIFFSLRLLTLYNIKKYTFAFNLDQQAITKENTTIIFQTHDVQLNTRLSSIQYIGQYCEAVYWHS